MIGSRTVVQVICGDWQKAFAVLEREGLIVRAGRCAPSPRFTLASRGAPGPPRHPRAVTTVPANLEEAFVGVVTAGPHR